MKLYNPSRLTLGALTLLCSVGLAPKSAQAVLVDVTVTGEITKVVNAIIATEFSVGQSMSATMTYDASTPPGSSLILTQALYTSAITTGDFVVGTYTGTVSGGNINIENDDPTFFDGIAWRGVADGPSIGSMMPVFFGVLLRDPTQAALTGLSLPLTTTDVAGFPDRAWGLSFGVAIGTDPPGVSGRLTSIELTVRDDGPGGAIPEPITATCGLMGLAFLTTATRRRRTS